MSKKSRRSRSKERTHSQPVQKREERQPQHPQSVSAAKISATAGEAIPSPAKTTHLEHIPSELWRIGIIAGALFLILIILAFVLG